MNTKILGNSLTFKTFGWLKVNNTEIFMPEGIKQEYYLKSDKKLDVEEFKNVKYGVSEECIELNDKFGNLYRSYVSSKDAEINEIVDLKQDSKNNILFDTHDLIAEENSKLNLILNYNSISNSDKYRNSIIRILAKENSQVNLYVIQNGDEKSFSLESILVKAEKNSSVNLCQFELGSKELYTNFQGNLIGNESNLNIDSIYFGYDDNKINMLYDILHYGEETKSEVVVNGALKDNSYKNFKSTLDFKEGSSFAVGSEEEYVVLMDDSVTALSVPILLAHEDNVEGNHAASAGKIDQQLLFYIMSRGFNQVEAESLIIESKFSRAIDKLENEELKEKLWKNIFGIARRR
ncbi:SufD family Fe-S cluster assembly protein [Peptoniphilus mikwangii]|uniref:SufD family Fe-S cluster assembly protein n=1 Tax=Peptoniphilus mikwangii TaxID=1354300 RepID=UPI0003F9F020|nr:SufD family Fe-S cluster assembly protein [Peptoniphilus mikwangii]